MILSALIPSEFWMRQDEWLLWLLGAGAIALLVVGADRAVGAAAKLAATLGMSKIIIGATVVSLGTTSPETAVSVKAAWDGDPGLALGNGMGSVICNTGMIFGLCCLIRRIPNDRFVMNRHGWFMVGAGLLLGAVMLGGWLLAGQTLEGVQVTRWMGLGFLAILAVFLLMSVKWAKSHPELVPPEAGVQASASSQTRQTLLSLAVLVVGLGLVVAGSELLVGSARELADNRYHIPKAIIAATFVAFGTSLPELVTAIASIVKGHRELLLGNILGANVLNVLFVIGASAVASPLNVDDSTFTMNLPVMLLMLIVFRGYGILKGNEFRRWMGAPLLGMYIAYVALLIVRYGAGS